MNGDKPDTMTNKKGNKKGIKRKQKGDKTDTMTKNGDKKGVKREQKGNKSKRRETRRTQ